MTYTESEEGIGEGWVEGELGQLEGRVTGEPTGDVTVPEYQKVVGEANVSSAAESKMSVSTVGAASYSGVVDWSRVPGGFQPLPQTTGTKKRLYQISQFHGGLNQRSSIRDIADSECTEAGNVTFQEIGKVRLLGDCLNEDNSLDTFATVTNTNLSGFGLFEFTAPVDPSGAVTGEQTILLTADGDQVDALCDKDNDGGQDATAGWIDMAGTDDATVAQIYYAANNGVYVADASFQNASKAKIYVYRDDAGSSQTVSGWKEGKPLIDSPTYDSDAHADMVAGTIKCVHTSDASENIASVAGTMIVECDPNNTGGWDGTYYFYCSWLFDGGTETGLTSFADDGGVDAASNGIAFSANTLEFNVSLKHTPHASANTELGADKRIEGARIYFKKQGASTERFLLAEINLIDGVRGANDSTFDVWTESSDVYSHTTIIFEHPEEGYRYESLNGDVYANEVYTESLDSIASTTAGPTALPLYYKTLTVGPQGIIYIGNVKFDGRVMSDSMMCSMPGKPGLFPKYNRYDSPSSDGSPIRALASFQDKILQFKETGLFVINVSAGSPNTNQFYPENIFRNCGVYNQCQVFTASFGVIFVNKFGVFIYDGEKVVSLTSGKFIWSHQYSTFLNEAVSNGSDAVVPSIGFDPRSQNIIVLRDIGDDGTNAASNVYNMATQSWSEGNTFITNVNDTRHTNFIITSEGYLSVKRGRTAAGGTDKQELLNYDNNFLNSSFPASTIDYTTKDFDFGFPSQTKKIFKVYITYRGNGTGLSLRYGVDGDTSPTNAMTNSATETANMENTGDQPLTIATYTLDTHPDNVKSIRFNIYGTGNPDFELNDISILYRLRPIK